MEEKNKKKYPQFDINKIFAPNIVVSSTESTELIPTPPLSVGEAESYKEIYDFPQPKDKADNDLQPK